MSMQNGRLAQLGTQSLKMTRPEVCELERNHHYHPDEFGSCHPGSKTELPAEDMEKNKRFLEHYTQKVDMSKALIS